MIELIQITNDVELARRCDVLGGFRLWVDLERLGKAERQAGLNTFITTHTLADVGRVKRVLRQSRLMVRVNPLHDGTVAEVADVLGQGTDLLMLPMFTRPAELREFSRMVDGRVPIVPLLETAGALETLEDWIGTPGLGEVYVGLNDLHLSLGCSFIFEPLANGMVERVAKAAHESKLPFGFGGIARMGDGELSGRDVLAEHLRLGSSAVIVSRTFHRQESVGAFEDEVATLRDAERVLAARPPDEMVADQQRIANRIRAIAGTLAPRP